MSTRPSQSSRGNDPIYWLIAIGLLFTGFAAPVGVIMIVLKLLGGKKRGRHPYYSQSQEKNVGARTTAAQEPSSRPDSGKASGTSKGGAPDAFSPLAQLTRQGKQLTRIGAIVSAVLAFIIVASLSDAAYWLFNGEIRWFFQEALDMLPFLCGLGGGLGCLWAGLRKQKQASRYRSYLAMIGSHASVSISALSSAAGNSPKQVREDLEDMLEDGLFPGGFLDFGGDRLVVSGDGLEDAPNSRQVQQEPPSQQSEDAILSEIKAVNDAVDNQKLSAQIDRIGVITAKILDYQRSHPEKSPQLHSFLSYYLPTTLKILRAYGQLEDQEVSGENITAAMRRIEGMMDKVVEGFEKQLDQLFQGDAMDITADVEVLERMLAKDGLSDRQGLTLNL